MRVSTAMGAACLAVLLSLATHAEGQAVRTMTGSVLGQTSGNVTSFKGIPLAAPPVRENRWRAPQPAAAWSGVRDATHFGYDCAQARFRGGEAPLETTPSEDWLYLNVWRPSGAKAGDGLPVFFWIYGGGWVFGGTLSRIYSGRNFARDGIIFVSANYRVGSFGFFAHPALFAAGVGGNFGFLDQNAALKWVRANIAAFGGDPGRVPVMGESAGGMSIHMLLQSPLARGLFPQAIIESGGGPREHNATPGLGAGGRNWCGLRARDDRRAVAGPVGGSGNRCVEHRRIPEQPRKDRHSAHLPGVAR